MEINSFRWEFKKTPGIRLLLSNFEIAGFLRQCILDTFLSSTWQNKTNFSDHLLSVRPSVFVLRTTGPISNKLSTL